MQAGSRQQPAIDVQGISWQSELNVATLEAINKVLAVTHRDPVQADDVSRTPNVRQEVRVAGEAQQLHALFQAGVIRQRWVHQGQVANHVWQGGKGLHAGSVLRASAWPAQPARRSHNNRAATVLSEGHT